MAGSGTAHLRTDADDVVLTVEHLVVEFPTGRNRVVHAVSDLSFDLLDGETLGLVGESGCGKSTTVKAVVQLPPPTAGVVRFEGHDLTSLRGEELRRVRPDIQLIFQDPISSLNPRRRVHDIVREGLQIWDRTDDAEARVDEVLRAVGLDADAARTRRAHEYSGGQCQRISIARALVLDPRIVICDEPVSALDVSVQAQILNLLEDMKARYGLSLLFISHDLAVVKNISDRVAVMYLGKLCEIGDGDLLYDNPSHPYTRVLLDAVPDPDRDDLGDPTVETGNDLPSPIEPPSGCRFRTRCPRAQAVCVDLEPAVAQVGDGDHWVACHFPLA